MQAAATRAMLFGLSLVLSGCGGCQSPGAPTASVPEPAAIIVDKLSPVERKQAERPKIEIDRPDVAEGLGPRERPADSEPAREPEPEIEEDCSVIFEAYPDYGLAPLTVQLDAEADCSEGQPSYSWDFGDGSATSHMASVSHTYETPGAFMIVLTVTGPAGGIDEDELEVIVEDPALEDDYPADETMDWE